ncbi:hypothetical protein L211DRAFT_602765 [Terfezia boudieri ATCC MYA-4762]|uniref:Uncharacterized protein n=1 Tax=Terfezia boudieri ATCC MYA-4762 TaxID=1051890 RepID=A0A3N4LVU0_9PEZI|nr:hypothetical protein L211DRAFT_602765 [Terfezia boudieri ATCC MYA-4762]
MPISLLLLTLNIEIRSPVYFHFCLSRWGRRVYIFLQEKNTTINPLPIHNPPPKKKTIHPHPSLPFLQIKLNYYLPPYIPYTYMYIATSSSPPSSSVTLNFMHFNYVVFRVTSAD